MNNFNYSVSPDIFESLFNMSFGIIISLIIAGLFVTIVLIVVPMCIIFKKAGRAWWEALIPFYNMYVLTVITKQPWWILFGILLPVVNWIVPIYLDYHLCKRFGLGVPFTVGVVLLPFIFLPILAFGDYVYSSELSDTVPTTALPSSN